MGDKVSVADCVMVLAVRTPGERQITIASLIPGRIGWNGPTIVPGPTLAIGPAPVTQAAQDQGRDILVDPATRALAFLIIPG
jgi:hypothetical protein